MILILGGIRAFKSLHDMFLERLTRLTDWLSKMGQSTASPFVSSLCFSSELRHILTDDVAGHTLVKKGA